LKRDLSYNHISNWHAFGDVTSLQQSFSPFQTQTKLIDLFLGHNLLIDIPERTFEGLKSLKVLDLVNNKITSIHPQVFLPLMALKDL
jgi:Leucine-rich repeat (LRR) protein